MTLGELSSQSGFSLTRSDSSASADGNASLQDQAMAAARCWTARTNELLVTSGSAAMPLPRVRFDLRGRAAGQTVFKRRGWEPALVRLNAELLVANPDDMINETVPHEIAHAAARWFYGSRIKPHGREWRAIMHAFGKQATTCHELPTRPARRMMYYPYVCACPAPNYLSAIRHKRVQHGRQRYQCARCGSRLRYGGGSPSCGHPEEA